jgi:protein TonB
MIGSLIFLYRPYTPVKKSSQTQEKRVLVKLITTPKEKKSPKVDIKPFEKKPTPKERTIPHKRRVTLKKKNHIKRKTVLKKHKKITKKIQKKESPITKTISKVITPTPVEREQKVETKQEIDTKIEQNYIDENIAKIRELIKNNLYYPRRARKRHIVGNVVVKFTLSKDARVSSIVIIHSQHEILSRSAIKTIKDLSSTFPKPKKELIIQLPINYSLK